MPIETLPPWFVRVNVVVFGLLWGSFLNVVIYRVPLGQSVVKPASRCPSCKKPIRPWDNIPVLSFLILRGKARCCGASLSPRYPLVELIGGVLSLCVYELLVRPLPYGTPLYHAAAVYTASFALAMGLVAAAFIDLEHMILPDSITYGGAVLGLATASFRSMSLLESALGAAAGFLMVWLPFIVIYPKIRSGKAGMGMGDAKLVALAGAWFGWGGALFVLLAGAVQGTIAAIVMLLVGGKIEDPEAVRKEREEIEAELSQMSPEERAEAEKELAQDPLFSEAGEGLGQQRLAFGPFLVLATLECLFVGRWLFETYWSWISV